MESIIHVMEVNNPYTNVPQTHGVHKHHVERPTHGSHW